jgi:hypothetical protein
MAEQVELDDSGEIDARLAEEADMARRVLRPADDDE